MLVDRLKETTNQFLQLYVFPHSKFKTITDENADEIVEYIQHTYVIPLVEDQEEGKRIDTNLLKMAEDAVDDICDN